MSIARDSFRNGPFTFLLNEDSFWTMPSSIPLISPTVDEEWEAASERSVLLEVTWEASRSRIF